MDVISAPYKCKIRPWRDSDDELEIQWFYAADGALPFPEWHRFGSGNWAPDREEWPGPGEVLGSRRKSWSDGPGHLDGLHYVGRLDDFQRGALRAAPGLQLNALCFPGEVMGADGGAIGTGGAITPMLGGPGLGVGGAIADAGWWTAFVPDGDCEGGGWSSFPPWGPLVPDGASVGGGNFDTYPLWPAMVPDGAAVGFGNFAFFWPLPPMDPDGDAVGLGLDNDFWMGFFLDGAAVGAGDNPDWWIPPVDGAAVGDGD